MPEAATTPRWFVDPQARFGMAVFWFWHFLPDEDVCVRALEDMVSARIRTVMVQARLPLPRHTYLSPSYLSRCRFVADTAAGLGLQVEIYDEYMWMSGHGGGRVVEADPRLAERHLFWSSQVTDGSSVALSITGIRAPFLGFLGDAGLDMCFMNGQPCWTEWMIVAAAGAGPTAVLDLTHHSTIVGSTDRSCTVVVDTARLPIGIPITVFVSARCYTSRLVNYLLPETAETFLEKVYVPLLQAFPAARSFFFDHPYASFYTWNERSGELGNSLLWDESLRTLLSEAPLATTLLALVRNIGSSTATLRGGFFETYAHRLHEAFFGTLKRWCDAHGVELSGHELLPHAGAWGLRAGIEGVDPRVMPGVDYFGLDSYRSATTVDAADYRPQLGARFGDSVARANGRSRCSVEQYSTGRERGRATAAGQWDLSLKRLRMQCIRHLMAGARRVVLHALFLDGRSGDTPACKPPLDFAPGFNLEPWWASSPVVFDELARLSAFLEDGTPMRSVALLYPLETIRAGGTDDACHHHFGWWAEALDHHGIGYDIVDECQFPDAKVEEGGIRVGEATYSQLILPAVTSLASTSTLTIIEAFSAQGGRLLMSGPSLSTIRDASGNASLPARLARIVGLAQRIQSRPDAVMSCVRTLPQAGCGFDDLPNRVVSSRVGSRQRMVCFNETDVERTIYLALGTEPASLIQWHPETGRRSKLAHCPAGGSLRLGCGPQELLCLEMSTDTSSGPGFLASSCMAPALQSSERRILDRGWLFHIPGSPQAPTPISVELGWEKQGYETYSGIGCYTIHLDPLPDTGEDRAWHLILPKIAGTLECSIDGNHVGASVIEQAAFDLSRFGNGGRLELLIRNSAANAFYVGTPYWDVGSYPSGLLEPPTIEQWERKPRLTYIGERQDTITAWKQILSEESD